MAIQLEKENGKFNIYIQHFLIDSAADLQTLESEYNCHQGDKAELPDGSYYLRHSDDYQGEKWELAESSSSGSGSSDLPPITSDDNNSFLVAQDGEWSKVGGYSVSESTETIIAEQSVTTAAIQGFPVPVGVITGDISSIVDGDKLRVTFNNVAYAITAQTMGAGVGIGEIDGNNVVFTNYPFFITSIDSEIAMFTEAAETYTVKVEKINFTTTITDNFIEAVDKANTILSSKVYIPKQTVTQTIEDMDGKALALADGISLSDVINKGESITVTVNGIQLQGTRQEDDFSWYYQSDEQSYWIGVNYLDDSYKLTFSAWDGINDCPLVGKFIVEGLEIKQSINGIPTLWFNLEDSNWKVTADDMQAIGRAIDDKTPIQAFAIQNDSCIPASATTFVNSQLTCFFYGFNTSRNDYFEVDELVLGLQNGNVVSNSRTIQLAYFSGER